MAKNLQELFRYEVLKMLKAEGKISDAIIENMLSWRHSGFNVYCGPTIWCNNDKGFDPLLSPKCHGSMKVVSFIEDDALIKKILMHLGLG